MLVEEGRTYETHDGRSDNSVPGCEASGPGSQAMTCMSGKRTSHPGVTIVDDG